MRFYADVLEKMSHPRAHALIQQTLDFFPDAPSCSGTAELNAAGMRAAGCLSSSRGSARCLFAAAAGAQHAQRVSGDGVLVAWGPQEWDGMHGGSCGRTSASAPSQRLTRSAGMLFAGGCSGDAAPCPSHCSVADAEGDHIPADAVPSQACAGEGEEAADHIVHSTAHCTPPLQGHHRADADSQPHGTPGAASGRLPCVHECISIGPVESGLAASGEGLQARLAAEAAYNGESPPSGYAEAAVPVHACPQMHAACAVAGDTASLHRVSYTGADVAKVSQHAQAAVGSRAEPADASCTGSAHGAGRAEAGQVHNSPRSAVHASDTPRGIGGVGGTGQRTQPPTYGHHSHTQPGSQRTVSSAQSAGESNDTPSADGGTWRLPARSFGGPEPGSGSFLGPPSSAGSSTAGTARAASTTGVSSPIGSCRSIGATAEECSERASREGAAADWAGGRRCRPRSGQPGLAACGERGAAAAPVPAAVPTPPCTPVTVAAGSHTTAGEGTGADPLCPPTMLLWRTRGTRASSFASERCLS